MPNLYYCEFLVCGNFSSRYVIAKNQLHAVELIILHYKTLSPFLKVTDITISNVDSISKQSIQKLHDSLHGNNY